jgi:hypothetical protein
VGPTFGLILELGLHSFVGFFSNLRIALFVGRREYNVSRGAGFELQNVHWDYPDLAL